MLSASQQPQLKLKEAAPKPNLKFSILIKNIIQDKNGIWYEEQMKPNLSLDLLKIEPLTGWSHSDSFGVFDKNKKSIFIWRIELVFARARWFCYCCSVSIQSRVENYKFKKQQTKIAQSTFEQAHTFYWKLIIFVQFCFYYTDYTIFQQRLTNYFISIV